MKIVLQNVHLITLTGECILYKKVRINLTVRELGPFPLSSPTISHASHSAVGSRQPFALGGITFIHGVYSQNQV